MIDSLSVFLIITISTSFAGAVFNNILDNIPQSLIERWVTNLKLALDQFVVFWFYSFLPWLEVVMIVLAGALSIGEVLLTTPVWNFALLIFCTCITLFCTICSFLCLKQYVICAYFQEQFSNPNDKSHKVSGS